MKDKIFFGLFKKGELVFEIFNQIDKNPLNILIANTICGILDEKFKQLINDDDYYIAFDYRRYK
jgi:hypothetical protein